jgi:very-short-patch-repair endonuclease
MVRSQIPGYVYGLCRKLRQKPTAAEGLLWKQLRTKNLNGLKFRRQHPIGRYIADLYCPEARLAIELNGSVHSQKDQKEYDRIRTETIESLNIRVLRIKNEEVIRDVEKVLGKIASLTSPP